MYTYTYTYSCIHIYTRTLTQSTSEGKLYTVAPIDLFKMIDQQFEVVDALVLEKSTYSLAVCVYVYVYVCIYPPKNPIGCGVSTPVPRFYLIFTTHSEPKYIIDLHHLRVSRGL